MIPHSPSPLPPSGPLCDPPPPPPEPQRVAPPLPEGPELPELRLTLLGAPQVALGATALSFKRRKAVALLAYLALTARQHSREALASLLAAADADDAQAKTQLRNTLYALGPQLSAYLQLTRETIGLHPARPLWVDARELQRAVLAASAPGADTRALAQAVPLYAGALLAGFSIHEAPEFEEWLRRERQRLHGLLVQGLGLLLARAQEQGDTAATLAWATRLLAEEPWQEEAHRALMRALARSGQRAAARAQYETCRRVLAEQLSRAPQAATEALAAELRAAAGGPPHNLGLPVAACVGRAAELALLRQRLEDPARRVLTLLGLGGSGKTALALAAAAHYVQPSAPGPALRADYPFPDGVFLVDLSALSREVAPDEDAARVLGRRLAVAIGQALAIDFANSPDPLPAVGRWLERKRLLLVLDNAEGLADGVVVVRSLVRQAPGLTVLATSRERLGLPEEWVLDVEGLDLPDEPAELEQAPATQLFLAQAQQVGASGLLTAEEHAAIVRICQVTQGLPLALILAARWRHTLSCAVIAAVLERGLDLLTTTERVVPERQRSMRAVLAATWARLAPQEQAALRQLAVCRRGCTLEAARAVAEVTPGTLLALRDRALLAQDADGRYSLHELVRQYATEQAATEPTEAVEAAGRHARYYAALVERAHTELWHTPEAAKVIAADLANVQAAWAWAAAYGVWGLLAQMRAGLSDWFIARRLLPQWLDLVRMAAGQLRTTLVQAPGHEADGWRVLGHLLADEAAVRIITGQFARGQALLDEAAALARALPAPMAQQLQGWTSYWRARSARLQRDMPAAQREYEGALALARTVGACDLETYTVEQLGRLAMERNDAAAAQSHLEHALALYQGLGDRNGTASIHECLAMSLFEQGRFAEARRCGEEALHFFQTFDVASPFIQVALGLLYDQGLGRHREAEQYFTQALARFQAVGGRAFDESYVLACLGRSALAQGDQPRARLLLTQALHTGDGASAMKGHTWAILGLGRLAHDWGDEREAQTLAERALDLAQKSWQRRAERFALRLLGHALAGQGHREQATLAYQQALAIDRTLGYQHLAIEITADLARVALSAGDLTQATRYAAAVLAYLAQHSLEGTEEPVGLYLSCFEVLRAASDPRAQEVLAAGHALLQERAAQFEDAERRRLFLEHVPAHRRLLTAWEERQDHHHGGAAAHGNGRGPLSDMLTVAASGGCLVDHKGKVVT